MAKIPSLPTEVRLVGYQVHERFDKSGYPRNRAGLSIHPYARIVAIADAYTAMTCPRPYRPALMPFEAARQILDECSAKKFDSIYVRAFLDCLSLFPIGSYVELDDGHRARVIRANPGRHTEPLVEIKDNEWSPATIVDLSKQTHLKIIRPLETCPT
jgi:HD-GYP domain-containing protein (c-di-GMP phosphodiesterase class II)